MMNEWRLNEALTSLRRLEGVVNEMTQDEVVRAIALEEESLRRHTVLQRLYRRARSLARASHEVALNQQIIKEK